MHSAMKPSLGQDLTSVWTTAAMHSEGSQQFRQSMLVEEPPLAADAGSMHSVGLPKCWPAARKRGRRVFLGREGSITSGTLAQCAFGDEGVRPAFSAAQNPSVS